MEINKNSNSHQLYFLKSSKFHKAVWTELQLHSFWWDALIKALCLLVMTTSPYCAWETCHGLEPPFHTVLQCGNLFSPLFFFFRVFNNVASGFDDLDTSGMGLIRWGKSQLSSVQHSWQSRLISFNTSLKFNCQYFILKLRRFWRLKRLF